MPFGYPLEADFDIAKEQRRDHLKWSLAAVLVLGLLYLFSGRPFAVRVFQVLFATTLYYGENFYVRRRDKFGEAWFWRALLATIPFHALYLAILLWSDTAFPNVMPKSTVVVPLLFLGFGIESALLDSFVNRFGGWQAGGPDNIPTF